MSLIDALNELDATSVNPNECGVKKITKNLSEEEAQAILKIIDKKEIPATQICTTLQAHGIVIGRDTLRRHRNRGNGGCSCPA